MRAAGAASRAEDPSLLQIPTPRPPRGTYIEVVCLLANCFSHLSPQRDKSDFEVRSLGEIRAFKAESPFYSIFFSIFIGSHLTILFNISNIFDHMFTRGELSSRFRRTNTYTLEILLTIFNSKIYFKQPIFKYNETPIFSGLSFSVYPPPPPRPPAPNSSLVIYLSPLPCLQQQSYSKIIPPSQQHSSGLLSSSCSPSISISIPLFQMV